MTTIDSKTSTAPDPEVIRVRDLRKRYGSFQAADGVTFAVDRGEVFGLLGPIRSPEPRDPRTEPLDPIPDRRRIPTRGMPAPDRSGRGGGLGAQRRTKTTGQTGIDAIHECVPDRGARPRARTQSAGRRRLIDPDPSVACSPRVGSDALMI